MPDVFDQLDVFDQVKASPPKGDVFDTVASERSKPVSQEFVVESPQPEKSRFNSFENAYNAAQSGIVPEGQFFDTTEQTAEALDKATKEKVGTQVSTLNDLRTRRDALLEMYDSDPKAKTAINDAFKKAATEAGVTVTEMDAAAKVDRTSVEDLKRVFPSIGDKTAKVVSGAQKGLAALSEGFISPEGLATMGLNAGPASLSVAAKTANIGFAAQMIKGYPEQLKSFYNAIKSGNLEGSVESGIGVVATPFFVKGILTPEKLAIVKSTEEAGAPATAKALDEALKGEGDTGNTKPDIASLSQTTDKVLSEAEPKVNLETPAVETKAAIPAPPEGFVRPEEVKPTETSVAEPEKAKDEARLTELDQQIKEVSKSVDEPGFEEKIQPLIQERETIKNKYGGNPPADNVVAPEPEPIAPDPPQGESSGVTSIKNATVDAERVLRGLPEMPAAEKSGWESALKTAKDKIATDPLYQDILISELIDNPREIKDHETAALTMRRVELNRGFQNAVNEGAKAFEAGDAEGVATAKVKADAYSNQLSILESVTKSVGTEQGRGLAARKMMMRDDYSLAALETRKRADNGFRKLTDTERTELTALANDYKAKFEALEKHLSEKESKTSDAALGEAHAEILKEHDKQYSPAVLKVAERIVAQLNKRADTARIRLKERAFRFSSGVDPTVLVDLAEVGAAHIANVGLDFAKWSAKMVEEYGQPTKEQLDEIWEASKKLWNKQSIGKKVKEKLEAGDKTAEIAASIKAKFESGKGTEIASLVQKLAREFVAKGIKDRDKLVDAVHEVLKTVQPEITKRETADAISGYGNFKQLSKDAIDVQLRDLKGQLQQISKLEDMAKGEAPKKTGVERRIPSDEERGLIKQVEESKKKGGYNVTNPETQLRSALQAIQTRLENQIADLEKEISTKEKIVKQKSETPTSPEIEALRARRDNLKEQRDAIFGKPEITDAQRLKAYKTRTTNKIAELEKRIKENDFTKKPKRAPVEFDEEATRLAYELNKSRERIAEAELKDWLKNRSTARKIFVDYPGEALNLAKAYLTGFELSGMLRQGGFLFFSRPATWAKAIIPMLKSIKSEEGQFKVNKEISERPNAQLYKQGKLYLADLHGKLSTMEELNMSRLAKKVPGMKAFERGYVTFLNKLRADTFDAMAESYKVDGKITAEQAKSIAYFINIATGRGHFGKNDNAGVIAAAALFSPRYVASRFQLLTTYPAIRAMIKGDRTGAKIIAKEYGRFLAGVAAFYAIATMFDDKEGVSLNPTSSNFLKVKVGNTYIDPLTGLIQNYVFMHRMISGESTGASGVRYPIRNTDTKKVPFGRDDAWDIASRYVRTKLAPVVGASVNTATGKDLAGKPTDAINEAKKFLYPITYGDLYSVMTDKEIGMPAKAVETILAFTGMGVQVQDAKHPQKDSQKQ